MHYIQELARIDNLKELEKLENNLQNKGKMIQKALNSEVPNTNMLEMAEKQIIEILEKENSLDLEEPLKSSINKRFEEYKSFDGDFPSKYFEMLNIYDEIEINLDEDKFLDKNAIDIKNIEFEGIAITEDSFNNLKEEISKNGIILQNRIKEEMHITTNFRSDKKSEVLLKNEDLGKERSIEILKYGELIKENVKLEDGTIKDKVVANQGVLVSKIDGKEVKEDTHITLSNNKEKMIVNINGKDKKVQIGAPVETKNCSFDKDLEIILQGKNAVFDKESNAYFKYEDKEMIKNNEIKKQILKKLEKTNEKENKNSFDLAD